jgi:allophanate hydrolase
LSEGPIRRPGLLRASCGAAIEVGLWAVPVESFGRLVAAVAPPLSIGTVHLQHGRQVKEFLAEAEGVRGSLDITQYGAWRAFVAA